MLRELVDSRLGRKIEMAGRDRREIEIVEGVEKEMIELVRNGWRKMYKGWEMERHRGEEVGRWLLTC